MLKTEDLELEITFIWSSTILPLQNCYLLKGLLSKLVINKSGYTKTEEAENKSHESFHSLIVVKGFSSFKSILNSLSSIFLFFFPLIFPAENQIINKHLNFAITQFTFHLDLVWILNYIILPTALIYLSVIQMQPTSDLSVTKKKKPNNNTEKGQIF